jgi:O-antigen/teichoic acid export membrane protein
MRTRNNMIFDKRISLSPWLWVRLLAHRVRSDSLLRNSTYIMSTTVATSIIGYLYWIVAARIYSAQDVGLAAALIAIMTLISTFANLGIGSTLVQMLPHREPGYAWSLTLNAGLATGILSGLLAGATAVVALPFFSPQFAILGHHVAYALFFIVGVPLVTVATLLDQTFIAERAASNVLVRNAAFAVLKLPLMVLPVLFAQVGALGIFSSWVLAIAATLIGGRLLLIPRLRRAYCLAVRGIVGQVRTMLSSFARHHFINIGGLAPMYLLPIFVTVRLSAADNAYFYTTSTVSDIFFMISSAVATSLFVEGSHAANDVLRKARSSAVIIGLLLGPAMLISFLGGHYILLLFGPDYVRHGLLLLMLLTVAAVPGAITNIYVSVLRVQNRLRHAALFNLGTASLTLALAWILLPMLDIAGVAWAILIVDVVGSLIAGADLIRIRRQSRGSQTGYTE